MSDTQSKRAHSRVSPFRPYDLSMGATMADAPKDATLQDVDITADLTCRTSRRPDYEVENHGLAQLAHHMAENPAKILQKLTEIALDLCRADTAGISLLETHDNRPLFRWEALAGVYAGHLNNTMPRNASPCGTTIDRNSTQLMYMAERAFPALKADPPVVEALLVPFCVQGKPIGTVWIVAHDERRKFDQEDERVLKTLAAFASAGWRLWEAQAQLIERIENLEDFHDVVVGRELKLIELEKELAGLKNKMAHLRSNHRSLRFLSIYAGATAATPLGNSLMVYLPNVVSVTEDRLKATMTGSQFPVVPVSDDGTLHLAWFRLFSYF